LWASWAAGDLRERVVENASGSEIEVRGETRLYISDISDWHFDLKTYHEPIT
jgi:hypothetical protein